MKQYLNRHFHKLRPFRVQLALLLCLLIFFGMYLASYQASTEKMKEAEIASTLEYMQRDLNDVGTDLLTSHNILRQLATDNSVKSLSTLDGEMSSQDFADIMRIREYLTENTQNDQIVDISLFVDSVDGQLISSTQAYHDLHFTYTNNVYYSEGLNYDEFVEKIRNSSNPRLNISNFALNAIMMRDHWGLLPGSETSRVNIIYTLPITGRLINVYAILSMDVNRIFEIAAANSDVSDKFCVYSGSELLYTNGDFPEIDTTRQITYDQDMAATLLSVRIPTTQLYLVTVLEDSVVLAEIQRLTQMSYIVTTAFIVACIVLLFTIVFSLVRPINLLAQKVGVNYSEMVGDVFHSIESSIDSIHLDNQRMITTISTWEPLLHTHIIEHMLRGIALTDVENVLLQMIMDESQKWHVALIGRLSDGVRIPEKMIADMLEEALICPLDDARTAVLVGVHDPDDFPERCERLLEMLNVSVSSPAYAIGYSPAIVESTRLHGAFLQAGRAIDKAMWWGNSAVIAYDGSVGTGGYAVPYDTLNQLNNLVMAGNIAGVEQLLEQEFRHASEEMSSEHENWYSQMLYSDLTGVLVRIADQVSIQPALENLRRAECQPGFEARSRAVIEAFRYAAEIRSCMLDDERQNISSRMKEYIQANYADSGLSLTRIADAFGICEQNFSKLFKDETGTNFSVYLEQVRISAAEQLLRSGASVSETAEKSGYASVNTFSKAFKRRCGVSPTEWLRTQNAMEII